MTTFAQASKIETIKSNVPVLHNNKKKKPELGEIKGGFYWISQKVTVTMHLSKS